MEEYRTYTLEELSIGKGNYGIAASAVPFDASLHTYLRITDINDDGSLNKSGLMSVDEDDAEKYLLKPNDIVFARTGNSTGRSYFYDGSDGELVYAGFLIKFSLDSAKVNPRILKYYTHSKPYYDWVQSFGTGSTRGNINAKTYGNMPITLPSRDIQDKIVDILKSLDDKIEANRRINDNFVIEPLFEILLIWMLTTLINDNLEQQGQALFEEFVMNPNKPRTQLLSDYALINPTRTIAKGRAARCIDMSSLPTKGTFPSDWTFKEYNGGMKFQNGDTIMARITPCLENGKTAYINFLDENEVAFGSTEYIVLSAHEGFCSELLYFLARYDDFVSYAVSHMNGSSGRQRVSGNDIANYVMPEITNETMDVVSEKLHGIMEVIKNNSLESRHLSEIRDALLPRLMSGDFKLEEVNM